MDRRIIGRLTLALALVAVLVVPRILHPPEVDGVAVIEPAPPPPVVGNCIGDVTVSYAFSRSGALTSDRPVEVVGCDQPHAAEIVQLADTLSPVDDPAGAASALHDFIVACVADISLQGDAVNGWEPDLAITTSALGPDAQQLALGQRWAACAVGVGTGVLDQPLADLGSANAPPALGACAITVQGSAASIVRVDCTGPHTLEIFGRRTLDAGSTVGTDDLTRSCDDLVAEATGRPGLVGDTSVRIAVEVFPGYGELNSGQVSLPLPADAVTGWIVCSIRTTDDRELTASLRQIGDAPLPWAR